MGEEKIAKRLKCTKEYVCYVRNNEGIYAKQKVQRMLKDGMSAEKIAEEGNVNFVNSA